MEEAGGHAGSIGGGWYGGEFGGFLAGGLSLGPFGTLVVVGGGMLGGGYLGDKAGRWIASGLHGGAVVIAAPFAIYNLTQTGMYLDDIAGPPEIFEGMTPQNTPDYYEREERFFQYQERQQRSWDELRKIEPTPYVPPLCHVDPPNPWDGDLSTYSPLAPCVPAS